MNLSLLRHALTILLLLSGIVMHSVQAAGVNRVLILNSYHQGMDWTDGEVAGLKAGFADSESTEFHIEYMDSKRLLDPTHFENLRQFLAYKYRQVQFSAVVVTDNDAFDFMRSHRDDLFPGVPVVFCGVNWFRDEQIKGLWGFTGVAESAESFATVELMLKLHPESKRIVVILDNTTTGKLLRSELESAVGTLRGNVAFEFWDTFTRQELSRKTSALSGGDLVLLMPHAIDHSGVFTPYADIARLITEHSPVPVYASWDFYLGHGIVGGNLTSAKAQGAAAGEMLLRILNGEDVNTVAVQRQIPGEYTFDYRQLTRFRIPESQLPPNSRLISQPWHRSNRGVIWSGALIAAIMIALLWSLLITLARKRRSDIELRIAAKAFESQVAMLVCDSQGIILRVNHAFAESTGYSAEEAIGRKTSLLKSGRHDKAFYEALWLALREKHYWQGVIWNRRKNGSIFAEWLTINAVVSSTGVPTHYVSAFSDITQNKDAEAEVHRLAYYDQLTQFPNRRLLQDRLGQALASADRSGAYGAALFIDLDNFNTLNDTRGHVTGDLLLIQVAQRLHQSLRQADTVARLGGDEFVLVLEELNTDEGAAATTAKAIASNLNRIIAQPYSLSGVDGNTTASIGICLFCGKETVEHVLKNAEIAMYEAKANGRNTLRFFDPEMQEALDKRSLLESDLRQALGRNEMQLHFQPQIDRDGQVVGAEVLLRWKHPERNFISPADFIPLAEETGLILPIGQWVLERACKQISEWAENPLTSNLLLSVNVSPFQFRQDGFVDLVRKAITEQGANPERLKLELTETLVLDDIEATIEKMLILKEAGVRFSMDDFGTGYSSLAYLTRLPLDELKIDKSFVSSLPGSRNDEIITQSIITMGQSLGLGVVAEGVETEAQRRFLEGNGCYAYQGYFYSRPVPLEEFMSYLGKRAA